MGAGEAIAAVTEGIRNEDTVVAAAKSATRIIIQSPMGGEISVEEIKKKRNILPIQGGDTIEQGQRELKIIDLPGHTSGSIAVLDVRHRVLISGDPIQRHGRAGFSCSGPIGFQIVSECGIDDLPI